MWLGAVGSIQMLQSLERPPGHKSLKSRSNRGTRELKKHSHQHHLHAPVQTNRAEAVMDAFIQPAQDGRCIVSFPGTHMAEWALLSALCARGRFSTACVFLPKSDPMRRYGAHEVNPETAPHCWCHTLYGEPKEWGCCWFNAWKENVKDAVRMQLQLVVVFGAGQRNLGVLKWKDLAREGPKLWNRVGLGGSQKGEVAWLKMMGYDFLSVDINQVKVFFGLGLANLAAVSAEDQRLVTLARVTGETAAVHRDFRAFAEHLQDVQGGNEEFTNMFNDFGAGCLLLAVALETARADPCDIDQLFCACTRELERLLRVHGVFASKLAKVSVDISADFATKAQAHLSSLEAITEQAQNVERECCNPTTAGAGGLRAARRLRQLQQTTQARTSLAIVHSRTNTMDFMSSVSAGVGGVGGDGEDAGPGADPDKPGEQVLPSDPSHKLALLEKLSLSVHRNGSSSSAVSSTNADEDSEEANEGNPHGEDGRRSPLPPSRALARKPSLMCQEARDAPRPDWGSSQRDGRTSQMSPIDLTLGPVALLPPVVPTPRNQSSPSRPPRDILKQPGHHIWAASCVAMSVPPELSPRPGRPLGGRFEVVGLRRRQPAIPDDVANQYGPGHARARAAAAAHPLRRRWRDQHSSMIPWDTLS